MINTEKSMERGRKKKKRDKIKVEDKFPPWDFCSPFVAVFQHLFPVIKM